MADDVDELYALPPEDFIKARDDLAKRLKAEGDKDAAAAVKKLPKPTVAAWALNQLPRAHPDVVNALVDAGAELRRAQRRAVSGIKDAGMATAASTRRDAVRAAAAAVAEILRGAGKDPQTADREIGAALEAATTDPEIAEQLEEGRFAKPPEPESDLGDLMSLSLAAVKDRPKASGRAGARTPAKEDGEPDRAEQQRRKRERDVAAARDKATAASKAAVDAERRADEARAAAQDGQAEAERLRKEADAASKKASSLDRAARDAEAEATKRREAAKVAADALAALERDG